MLRESRTPVLLLLAGLVACSTYAAAGERRELAAQRVVEATIAEVQRWIRSGELSCEEIVSAYLERISAYDRATGLNAITSVAGDALARARAADRSLARGARQPPLFCVTVAVKDNMDTADMPTTGGSIVLRDSLPPDDAAVVRVLRAAGAIVLAKTNMAEWAFSPRYTISSTAGETANAYVLEYVPAGSSGGTAAAVAASFALVGLGSDTGNSIRGPSSHLALVGMRPTYGRVSLDGVIPLLLDRDAVGPMTRTVEDNARVLSIIAATGVPVDAAASFVQPLEGKRIGVLRALAQPQAMHPEIAALFERAIQDLRKAGAVIVDGVTIEGFEAHVANGYACPRFRQDANAYLHSLGQRAPVLDIAEVFHQGRFAPPTRAQFEYFLNESGDPSPTDCPMLDQHPGRQAFRKNVVEAMDRAQLSALVYPTWTFPPALRERAVEDYRGDNSQRVAPATGLPALTVPMGYAQRGLPAGLQLLGRPWAERELYSLAWQYERLTQHRIAPKLFPPLTRRGSGPVALRIQRNGGKSERQSS